jgi:hypothetical protein
MSSEANKYSFSEEQYEVMMRFASAASTTGTCFAILAPLGLLRRLMLLSAGFSMDALIDVLGSAVALLLGLALLKTAKLFRATLRGEIEDQKGIVMGLSQLSRAFVLYAVVTVSATLFVLYSFMTALSA